MPNYCSNTLHVTGDESAVTEFVKDARCEPGSDNSVLSFQRIVPVPSDILEKPYGPYGYWAQLILWGTKWGACHAEVEKIDSDWAIFTFDTASSPPIPFLIRASEQHPGVRFRLRYDSADNDTFGQITLKDGKVLSWQESAEVMEDKEAARRELLEEQVCWLGDCKDTWPRFGGKKAVREFVNQVDATLGQAL